MAGVTDCAALGEAVAFLSYFNDHVGPRQQGKVTCPLDEVLLLCLLAVLDTPGGCGETADMRPLILLATLALITLPGCRLVDQRSFEAIGLSPGAAELAQRDYAQRALPPPPLATIRFGTAVADWRNGLIDAARAARARRADVAFDVVAPLPLSGGPAAQDAAARIGAQDAAEVAIALQSDGVSPEQIHLGARGDTGQPPREIEVYVR